MTCGRGNLSFTSVNLPRLGLEARNGDMDKFLRACWMRRSAWSSASCCTGFKIQCAKKVRNYPFLMGKGVWLDSDKLDWDDGGGRGAQARHPDRGLHRPGRGPQGPDRRASRGKRRRPRTWAWRSSGYMRRRMRRGGGKDRPELHAHRHPGGGPVSGRFVSHRPEEVTASIPGVTDRDYYTNSFHVPVYYPIKAFEKIQLEAPYHALTNAGHITYVELDGDTCKNPGGL